MMTDPKDFARRSTLDLMLRYNRRHPDRYLFPIRPGHKFPPLLKSNLDLNCSTDPKRLTKWHDSPRMFGCNWGIALRKSNLFVADVDTNPAKNKIGQQTYDVLDLWYGWPPTEIVRSPSGGHHHVYRGRHIMAIGDFGLGRDIDSPNYVLIPGCRTKDGVYRSNGAEAVACPDWIYALIAAKRSARERITNAGDVSGDLDYPASVAWAIDFLRDAEPAVEGQGGEYHTLCIGMILRDVGISEALAVELINEHFNPRCEPMWDIDELTVKIHNSYAYASQSTIGGRSAQTEFADDDFVDAPVGKREAALLARQRAERVQARIDSANGVVRRRPDKQRRAASKRARSLSTWSGS
jgi:hypothetical protein